MIETAVPNHVTIDDKGVARIDGSRFKVVHLIEAMKANHSSADELACSYPQLTKSQIHSALAYYYDHEAEIDADIARRVKVYEDLRAAEGDFPGQQKLRELGLIP